MQEEEGGGVFLPGSGVLRLLFLLLCKMSIMCVVEEWGTFLPTGSPEQAVPQLAALALLMQALHEPVLKPAWPGPHLHSHTSLSLTEPQRFVSLILPIAEQELPACRTH